MRLRNGWIPVFAGVTGIKRRASTSPRHSGESRNPVIPDLLRRRFVFIALLLITAACLSVLMASVLAPGGWTFAKIAILIVFIGVAPWIGVCVGNALLGFLILVFCRAPARAVLPVSGDIDTAPITVRTAIAITVRNENIQTVLRPLGLLLDGLSEYGDRFAAYVLSDSDAAHAAAEAAAIDAFSYSVHYRRRTANAGFKAGNVMDFLDHHAQGFDLALMLDADSEMSPEAVLRLVRIMQASPSMAIVQHLTVGRPAAAALPRLFQFGMRAGMRVWATGQAWWQGADGPYWGHNAIVRIAPFQEHARLGKLPDGSFILSHDQVEAACLTAAGWGVTVWAIEGGSLVANRPALPEFLHRDARWLAGNLQYVHLLRARGFTWMGRWQLL